MDVERVLPRGRGRRRRRARRLERGRGALLALVEERGITITHVLVTHQHMDHVVRVGELGRRFAVPVVGGTLTGEAGVPLDETWEDGETIRSGGMEIRTIATPGHCPDHFALLVNGTDVLTADCLFKGTIGGTGGGGPDGYANQRHSIMDVLMALTPETRVHPGHTLPTTCDAIVGGSRIERI